MEDKYSFLSGMKRSSHIREHKRAAETRHATEEGSLLRYTAKPNRIAKSTRTAGNGYGLYQASSV